MKSNCSQFIKTLFGYLVLILVFLSSGNIVVNAQTGWRKTDELFEAMELEEDKWVADIGSSSGYYTTRMAPIVSESGHVFAVDINEGRLERMHSKIRQRGFNNITTIFSIPENPMLPPGILDGALVRNAYHEFTDPMSMLRHIRNALKTDGLLVLADPMSPNLKNAPREVQVDDHELAIHIARKELRQAGFTIVREVEKFSRARESDGKQYWMIVASPDK